MTATKRLDEREETRLIEEHVDLNYDRYGGRADARMKRTGASVWAIVMFLDVYDGDLDELAGHFDLTREEIDAAFAYYRRNKRYVDARIILNES